MTDAAIDLVQHSQQQKLEQVFTAQQEAFRQNTYPDVDERVENLKRLKQALLKHKKSLAQALSEDFLHRSETDTLLADVMPTVQGINYAIKKLKSWVKTDKRHVPLIFQPAQLRVEYQPLGVIGIIVPWNYPVFLSLGPLTAALAAGNRAMLKLSEFTPAANQVINNILSEAFAEDCVCVIQGEAEVAKQFSQLPFDHLMFTGSTQVGSLVMQEAAKNLTPVTLELGGKSPVIVADDVSVSFAVERILFGKCLNAGQTCVAPDYILCPEHKVAELIDELKRQFNRLYPKFEKNKDYTGIINTRQKERLESLCQQASEAGAEVIALQDGESEHKIPLTLLLNAPDNTRVMQEEIFGPLMPIVSYRTEQEALDYVNQRPRPLALYLITHNKALENKTVKETHAGGMCVNDTAFHVAQEDAPFGGIGPSGMGHYHGKEGFLTFSKAKTILKKGKFNSAKTIFPPYGIKVKSLLKFILR